MLQTTPPLPLPSSQIRHRLKWQLCSVEWPDYHMPASAVPEISLSTLTMSLKTFDIWHLTQRRDTLSEVGWWGGAGEGGGERGRLGRYGVRAAAFRHHARITFHIAFAMGKSSWGLFLLTMSQILCVFGWERLSKTSAFMNFLKNTPNPPFKLFFNFLLKNLLVQLLVGKPSCSTSCWKTFLFNFNFLFFNFGAPTLTDNHGPENPKKLPAPPSVYLSCLSLRRVNNGVNPPCW